MKLERDVARKITKDILISIFLYALPVLLMFITFYFTGHKPWQNKIIQTESKK